MQKTLLFLILSMLTVSCANLNKQKLSKEDAEYKQMMNICLSQVEVMYQWEDKKAKEYCQKEIGKEGL